MTKRLRHSKLLFHMIKHLPWKFKSYCDRLGINSSAAYQVKTSLYSRKVDAVVTKDSHYANLTKLYASELAESELVESVCIIAQHDQDHPS